MQFFWNVLPLVVLLQVRALYATDLLWENPDTDIWNYEELGSIDNNPAEIFSALCENYNLIFRNRKISCDEISLERVSLDPDKKRIIVKRNTDDEALEEGSGEEDIEESPPTTNSTNQDAIDLPGQPQPEIEPYLTTNNSDHNIVEEPPAEVKQLTPDNESPENSKNDTTNNEKVEEKQQTSTIILPPLVHNKENSQEEKQTTIQVLPVHESTVNIVTKVSTDKTVANESASTVGNESITQNETTIKNQPENKTTTTTASPTTERKIENENATTTTTERQIQSENAKGNKNVDSKVDKSKAVPSDLTETDGNKKEKELIDTQQSSNAEILLKESQGVLPVSNVEGSEAGKILQKLSVNSDATKQSEVEPNTGESTRDVAKAGKDTTVLVVLFVVVLAVGGAAFAYNFVKKRRSKRADRGAENNHSNSCANGKNSDVEQGTELKPLIKNTETTNPVKTVEKS